MFQLVEDGSKFPAAAICSGCGEEFTIAKVQLNNKYGCRQCSYAHMRKNRPMKTAYYAHKGAGKVRGHGFLKFSTWKSLVSEPCYYCGTEWSNCTKFEELEFRYNGIDRVDNNLGYVEENCVPCCSFCNMAKRDLSSDEFISMCKKVAEYASNRH